MKTDKEFKPNLIELGEKIYQLRILKKYTPKEIAPKLNLSTVAYRNIEKGNCDLSYTKLLHLAEIFQVDISELVRGVKVDHVSLFPVTSPARDVVGFSGSAGFYIPMK